MGGRAPPWCLYKCAYMWGSLSLAVAMIWFDISLSWVSYITCPEFSNTFIILSIIWYGGNTGLFKSLLMICGQCHPGKT